MVRLASPFVTTLRELLEMRYLWRLPLRLSNARLLAVLAREPHTSLDEAVEATLVRLGCLSAPTVTDAATTTLTGPLHRS